MSSSPTSRVAAASDESNLIVHVVGGAQEAKDWIPKGFISKMCYDKVCDFVFINQLSPLNETFWRVSAQ